MNKKLVTGGVIGTIISIICCTTPILVIVLTGIGLAALVGYIDIVVIPILFISIITLIVGLYVGKKPVSKE